MWHESARNARGIHDLLNYRLARLLAVSSLPVLRLCEGRYGIARREWGLIAVLGQHGEMAPSALATEAAIDRARTSRLLSQLVEKRLVERQELRGDRRRAIVRLSAEGTVLYQSLLPQIAEMNRRLVSVLDDEDLKLLDDMLIRLTAQAHALRDERTDDRTQRRLGIARRVRAVPK